MILSKPLSCRYTLVYLLLFVATLVQYFITCGSSPGYVLDAMKDFARADASLRASEISVDHLGETISGDNGTNWTKLVMGMYRHGTSVRSCTCSCCNVVQPPRAAHCHDCDKCVLQFDHHCVWLGTCIGQGNHCQFWWYLFEETALCIWTGIWYMEFLQDYIREAWLIDVIIIIMLVVLSISLMFLLLLLIFHSYLIVTNQTTHELVRRRRIAYMRSIPERVYPFSKGVCRNLYRFCCARSSIYRMEALPSAEEVAQMSIPYSCFDVLSCRCC
ncbi:protein S-acyltransferase 10-like isoform X2 [Cynara cardunculus var. scolymus]|uniref:protein S-acyltransferase 10-like isoform X2 n=1 Tax=Cynara cardunculus var. scolymus TaxID=59895 RepID=UPI000D630DD1|nr:protein S-acyltransferase 10-like isoform X2 [Cynara cardunculus var. scolymus]